MDKMLAVSVLGLLALGPDIGSLTAIAGGGGRLSLNDAVIEAPRTLPRLDDETLIPWREIEDIQAPLTR